MEPVDKSKLVAHGLQSIMGVPSLDKLNNPFSLYDRIYFDELDQETIDKVLEKDRLSEVKPKDQRTKKLQSGGDLVSQLGYRNDSPFKNAPQLTINSPSISMENVSTPLIGISNQTGETKLMKPNKKYKFKNTKSVTEVPAYQNGGTIGRYPEMYKPYIHLEGDIYYDPYKSSFVLRDTKTGAYSDTKPKNFSRKGNFVLGPDNKKYDVKGFLSQVEKDYVSPENVLGARYPTDEELSILRSKKTMFVDPEKNVTKYNTLVTDIGTPSKGGRIMDDLEKLKARRLVVLDEKKQPYMNYDSKDYKEMERSKSYYNDYMEELAAATINTDTYTKEMSDAIRTAPIRVREKPLELFQTASAARAAG